MLTDPDSIRETLKAFEVYIGPPNDVQMMRAKEGDKDQRMGAWIEMSSAENARLLLSYGTLMVDGQTVDLLQPTRPMTKEDLRRDWICTKCSAMNFSRRMECFQCSAPREGNARPVEADHKAAGGLKNENVVVVRDLSEYVEEETLRRVFASYGSLREVRLVRDSYTQLGRGFAFIEYDSYREVTSL